MRVRWALAAGFVAAVGTVIVLRDNGYLLGRERGGPLHVEALRAARHVKREQPARFRLEATLDAPVAVQDVRPIAHSPELFFTKRVDGRPLEKRALSAADLPVVFGLRARRPGLYYLVGLLVDYRDGARRFRAQRDDQILCIAVATRQQCDLGYRGPGHAPVAQIGGPGSYPGARLSPAEATYDAGRHVARVTLTNRTHAAVAVSGLDAEPAALRLGPRGHRVVKVHVACDGARRLRRLDARVDGKSAPVPLSLPIACAG